MSDQTGLRIETVAIGFDADALAELFPDSETPQFEPVDPADNKRLDEKAGSNQTIICPHCHHEFTT